MRRPSPHPLTSATAVAGVGGAVTPAGASVRRRGTHGWWAVVVAVLLLVGGPGAAASAAIEVPGSDSAAADTDAAPDATTPAPDPTSTDTSSTDPSAPQTAPPATPSEEPTTDTPTTSPTTPEEPTESPTSQAPEEPTPTPTPTPTQDGSTPAPSDEPTSPQAPVIKPVPPAVTTSNQSAISWIIALVVLAASALVLVMLRRRAAAAAQDQGTDTDGYPPYTTDTVPLPPVPGTPATQTAPTVPLPATAPLSSAPSTSATTTASAAVTFAAIEAVGEAMLDATYSVITIEAALEDIARANSYPDTEVVVMPTALFVSTRGGGELFTGAISSGRNKLLLHQVDALDELLRRARAGDLTPGQILDGINEIRTAPSPFTRPVRIAAYVLLCAGLAVILGASWGSVAIACVLGALVGTVLLSTANISTQRAPLITVGLAFGVSTTVFLLARAGWDATIFPSLIAPLVILLPGALLTTGIIELAAGQMMSGAGRLMAGFMQLVLLSVGIVAGATLVGIPKIALSETHESISAIAPWIAVAAYGVGIVVYQCGRRASIPWILLVLYVAYGAQVIGEIFFGGVLSALIGAFVMTPVAVLVSRNPTGPAATVSFLPAFWLLVPGALGLVGVASILDGTGDGGSTMVTTLSTMVAIALGILAGSALGARSKTTGRDVL